MTTVLADRRWGVMAADSNMTDGDRRWSRRKVHRVRGALVGFAGSEPEFEGFMAWLRAGMAAPPTFAFSESAALVLRPDGLFFFDNNYTELRRVAAGREAIGTGSKGAMCAYEALAFVDPAAAVRIACKHDDGSRPPVRTYHLKRTT